ncbi:FtsK/SpoIIIE domain-containing protein [Thermopolyspora sp. NPDC052614]|uniref:FtsK/SpoIIIE domain-containing protein n=1 Tax=Thermopolyspora sp. NPDC052614 TaxID=3155682 RepID=UPI00341B8315
MNLTVTTVDSADGVRRDHLLALPPHATVADLAAALDRAPRGRESVQSDPASAGTAGRSAERPDGGPAPIRGLYLGRRLLDPAAPVASAGVRMGTVLGLGGPAAREAHVWRESGPPEADAPVVAEVHLVSGPGAGRIWRLTPGSHEIGSDSECAIRLGGPDVPECGLWVTVRPDGSAYWHRSGPETGTWTGEVRRCTVASPPDAPGAAGHEGHGGHDGAAIADSGIGGIGGSGEISGTSGTHASGGTRGSGGGEHGDGGVGGRGGAENIRRLPPGATDWPVDEDLVVGSALLRLSAPVEADAAVTPSADGAGLDYNRPPRIPPHLETGRLRMPIPPTRTHRRPFPLLIVIAPVVLGFVLVWVFRSYFYLVFVFFTPVLALANWINGRRDNRKQYAELLATYRRRLAAVRAEAREAADRERRARGLAAPDPATVALTACGPGSRLWERRRADPDHLMLRLGTVDQPSMKELEDPSRDENHRTIRWTIPEVPIGVEVPEHGVVGVAGTPAAVQALARWMVTQAAVLHSPRDVRIVVLTDPARAEGWQWARWLPHLRPWSAGGSAGVSGGGSASGSPSGYAGGPVVCVGNDPESVANRVTELVAQVEARQRALGSSMGKAMFTDPDVLVIVDGARRLRDVPGMVQILTAGPHVRVFAICLDEKPRLLPEECGTVVLADEHRLTVRLPGAPDVADVRADLVEPGWCEEVARALAPIRDVSPEHDSGLPRQVRLLDLLDLEPPTPAALLDRWRQRPSSTSFVLGSGYDGPLVLDLVRDGPHGLVAGTTGSGKSELLQTFVASLAAANRPDEMTFVLVDYKGGSAFRECAELPHTLGMVTDLDAHLVKRALESLGAELRRREHILNDAAAKDHPEYQAKRAADPSLPRLPRLILVIDEFATLVREVPDFVPGLIGVAQRGRSLGIHLVLATQRPAGAVTSDIRANTNLRIALRVTDATESQDIIDSREAVHIPSTTPGRALVRLGPHAALPFQSAWVGAERPRGGDGGQEPRRAGPRAPVRAAELSWSRLGRPAALPAASAATPEQDQRIPVELPPTDLQALVAAARQAAQALDDFTPQPSPWLPPLAEQVLLDELPEVGGARTEGGVPPIPYALEDIPELQERRVATADTAVFGHLYVIGAPRSGRTQVLRTLAGSAARTASSADVHIYGLDAGGGGLAALEALPHCGAVVSRHDTERIERLLHRLIAVLTERQERCSARGVAGIGELRATLPASERPAHILLLIDGWDALAGVLEEHDHGRLLDLVTRLLREGAAMGVHVVATSERSLLGGRLAAHNDHKLLLRQGDRTDYQLIGLAPSMVPSLVPPGRGWHMLTRTETQVALLAAGVGGQEQVEALHAIGERARRRDARVPAARRPFRVAALPRSVEFAAAYEQVPAELRRPMWGLLGLGGDDAGPIGVDFAASVPVFGVFGPPGTGRSNTLAALAVSLLAGGTALVVLTPRDSPLRALDRHAYARVLADIDPSEQEVRQALEETDGPAVVVLDDADLLGMPACDRVLKEIAVSGRDHGLGLLYAGPADALQAAMGTWATAARRTRRGLLLAPKSLQEGELIGVRLPTHLTRSHPSAGRGWTAGPSGGVLAVQVPLTPLRTDA